MYQPGAAALGVNPVAKGANVEPVPEFFASIIRPQIRQKIISDLSLGFFLAAESACGIGEICAKRETNFEIAEGSQKGGPIQVRLALRLRYDRRRLCGYPDTWFWCSQLLKTGSAHPTNGDQRQALCRRFLGCGDLIDPRYLLDLALASGSESFGFANRQSFTACFRHQQLVFHAHSFGRVVGLGLGTSSDVRVFTPQ